MEKDKQKYEPPRAMRLDDKELGKGLCNPSGSGDTYCLNPGNGATWQCNDTGPSADSYCNAAGSSAGYCSTGNSPG